MNDLDKYMVLYLNVARQHIEIMISILNPSSKIEIIHDLTELHRHAHSLKGETNAMNFSSLGSYLNVIEKYLKLLIERQQPLTQPDITILLKAIVFLKTVLETIEKNHQEPDNIENGRLLLMSDLNFKL